MTEHRIPHNVHNPHLLVLAQQNDVIMSSASLLTNDFAHVAPTAMLIEDQSNFEVLKRYINQLLKYKHLVNVLGPAVLHTAAQEVDGQALLSQHGLLTSNGGTSRIKACTKQLLTHAQRTNRHQDLCQKLHDTVAQLR
jgi:hypothetical protein